MTFETADGVRLVADAYGPEGAMPPVVCLPGLTRNARDFAHLAATLAKADPNGARRVIVLESRGRGRSAYADPETYTLPQELADLVAAMDHWGIERADVVGTSRGGLMAMLLAMTEPRRLNRVVLNDIGPTIEPAGLARIAKGVGTTMHFASFEVLAEGLKRVNACQFPRLTDAQWRRFAGQLASPDGDGVSFDYDPALAEGFASFSADQAAPDFWPAFNALVDHKVMVVRGANSDILSAATVEAMRRRHRGLHALVVADEGHAPLLWDKISVDTIKEFLRS
ncbi:alpha/beta fold hydrolase [Acuticoccus mangrovi]|uniref:Alpha/beta hydrolase n=1 Tax=Acuticoccus mangrovi TaxID=2796142 RepID=A0A934IMN0_9HYPH|nr:alpha/beta hydrolase [Acuticoccus mangrovi]MBJ3775236.1 alpha/beta hydrolase [Acuticoccus mangrovi]